MVDTLVPGNSITVPIKVNWINQVQNQFFRDYPLTEAFYPYNIEPDQQFYKLPDDCPDDRIKTLTIDGELYPYIPQEQQTELTPERFCTIISGAFMIHPMPTKYMQGFLNYRPRPVQLTVDNPEAVPTFPLDFHEMLVFGCAARIAKAEGNTGLGAVYDNDFAQLAVKADNVLTRPKQKSVSVVRGWR